MGRGLEYLNCGEVARRKDHKKCFKKHRAEENEIRGKLDACLNDK